MMPALTEEEEERNEPQPHVKPAIDKIAKLIAKDGRIDQLKGKMDKARSDLGTEYQKIENDLHGNRAAVKLIHKLRAGTIDDAYSFMRTFLHLADVFDLLPPDDLVDLAQKVDTPREEEEPGISAGDVAPKSAKVVDHPRRETAIDRAQKAMAGGNKPDAPKGPEGDTDLVDAADPDGVFNKDGTLTPHFRINLKKGWIERFEGGEKGDRADDSLWVDFREARPEELAAERERNADFAPEPAA